MSTPPPAPELLTPRTLAKRVLSYTLTRPLVLYPAAVGILGGAAALVLGPSLPFLVAAGAGAAVGLGAWGFDYGFRRDRIAGDYVRRTNEALSGRLDATTAQLRGELKDCGETQALAQLDRLHEGYASFERMLRSKMEPSEITFGRYLSMTEQVYLAGLDNMRQIVEVARGSSATERERSRRELAALEGKAPSNNVTTQRKLAALRERVALDAAQAAKREGWLAENEEAITLMDKAIATIAELDAGQDLAKSDMRPALTELQHLVDRTAAYDRYQSPAADAPRPQPLPKSS